ncbi:MAG TPA: tetratricopeptide repeat protein [Bacteroidales bacterium]|nr:tetratricopeptide repeat protein [Bacteroidales bacterium]
MEAVKVIKKHKVICRSVVTKKVKQSLDQLRELIEVSHNGDHRVQLENLESTYRNMIKYTAEGINDPQRNKVYYRLLMSIISLADDVKQDILAHYSGWHTYWLKSNTDREQKLTGGSIIESVDDLIFKEELDEWLKISGTTLSDPQSEIFHRHQKLIVQIFNHLWLTDRYGDAENELVRIIGNSKKFTWYEQSIFISAITLSALRVWEPGKIFYLTSVYQKGVNQVKERALAGLILILHYYEDRLKLYPDLISHLEDLGNDEAFRKSFKITVMQTIRSRETERISRKLHDEILPKVSSLRPKIEEKLDLENLLPEDLFEGKNPDWSDMFEESEDIYKTMEEFSKLQMEGADVYMSAFANLKHFDFFNIFSNWFLPFHPDHEVLNEVFRDEVLSGGTDELAEALYKTPFICNSDKYSLVLNLKNLPSNQKTMMLKVFKMELEGLEQIRDREFDLNPEVTFKTNVTQYLQDFYRFFKLSPYKKEFDDIFSGKLDIHNSYFFNLISGQEDILTLADYYFGKDFYDEALELYNKLTGSTPDDPQLFEKSGYCLQQKGDYEEALVMYKNADLLDHKIWTLKKIGFCLRRLGKHDQALESYLDSESLDPENMHTIAMIGHCYLDLQEYEQALKYYFKVEYNDPDNRKIHRPIAWCYFVMGKFDLSRKYYDKLSDDNMTAHDLINIGHLYLCIGERAKAIDNYRRAIMEGQFSKESFIEVLDDDIDILRGHGVDPDDLPIITDYLLFDLGY